MKIIEEVIIIILSLFLNLANNVYAHNSENNCLNNKDENATEIIILGSFHDCQNRKNFNCDLMKEIMIALKPDAILVELRHHNITTDGKLTDKALKEAKEEGHYNQVIENEVANLLKIKLIPFEWEERNEYWKKTKFWERADLYERLYSQWKKDLRAINPDTLDLKIREITVYAHDSRDFILENCSPEILNSIICDNLEKIAISVYHEIYPLLQERDPHYKQLAKEGHFHNEEWTLRNKNMAENIIKAAEEYSSKRLVVSVGWSHRYILRDLLSNEKNIILKEFWEILPEYRNRIIK